jgi:hypothetical protein
MTACGRKASVVDAKRNKVFFPGKAGPVHNKKGETSGRDNFWTVAMVATAIRSAEQARNVSVSEVVNLIASGNGDLALQPGIQPELTVGEREVRMNGSSTPSVTPRDSRPKTLVIGWDAADAELVEQWCADGLLRKSRA